MILYSILYLYFIINDYDHVGSEIYIIYNQAWYYTKDSQIAIFLADT